MITRKNNVLLSFLKIRAIINGKDIYLLPNNKPVPIPMTQKDSKIVVTDGYHFTKEFEVIFHHIHTYYFNVVCAIDDFQLGAGFSFLSISYLVGFFSGIFFLKLISFFPVFYFLFLYYINKEEFIQLRLT